MTLYSPPGDAPAAPGRYWALAFLVASWLLSAISPAHGHNAAFTLTSVEWNPQAASLEVIHRLHAEHALEAIHAAGGSQSETLDKVEGLARLGLYVEQRFSLTDAAGAPLPLEFVGAQTQGEFVFVYQEIPLPIPPPAVTVASQLMKDLPGEHVNHVNLRIAGAVGTLIFGRDRTPKTFGRTALSPAATERLASPDMSPPTAPIGESFGRYLVIGFQHIIPMGIDHILFVLGLFLSTTKLRPLIWQVSAFTLAHSVTLALATLGVVDLPPRLIETLIALSIAYVGVENLVLKNPARWRPAVVFGFGLLHGLGFAGALSEIGLPAGQLAASLLAFNIGVEIGQLCVVAIAFAALSWFFGDPRYRKVVVVPGSLGVALVGAYWTLSRAFGG
ncbi:MAG: HupE/UreJ family protein [Pseudomonadota bacterium]